MSNTFRSFALNTLVAFLFFVDLLDDCIEMFTLEDTFIDDFSVSVRLGLYQTLTEDFGIEIEEFDL